MGEDKGIILLLVLVVVVTDKGGRVGMDGGVADFDFRYSCWLRDGLRLAWLALRPRLPSLMLYYARVGG